MSTEQVGHFDSAFDSSGKVWYAGLLLLISFKTGGPVEPSAEVALMQWFEPVPSLLMPEVLHCSPFHMQRSISQAFKRKTCGYGDFDVHLGAMLYAARSL